MEAILILVGFIAFDLAAWRWGADSRESFDSPEWQRRLRWRAAKI